VLVHERVYFVYSLDRVECIGELFFLAGSSECGHVSLVGDSHFKFNCGGI